MKFRHVNINGFRHTVIEEPEPSNGERECYGYILHAAQRIVIDALMTDNKKVHTLVHECLHSYDVQYGLQLEEEQIMGLATAVLDFVRRNKHVIHAIWGAR